MKKIKKLYNELREDPLAILYNALLVWVVVFIIKSAMMANKCGQCGQGVYITLSPNPQINHLITISFNPLKLINYE